MKLTCCEPVEHEASCSDVEYGFYGISYEWISRVLASEHTDLPCGRIVVDHLGNGASLCALKEGTSVDTTMGMTARSMSGPVRRGIPVKERREDLA